MQVVTLINISRNLREQLSKNKIHLLFELNLGPDELKYLRDRKEELISIAKEGRISNDITVAYFLMDVGRRTYDDGTFWNEFNLSPNEQGAVGRYFENTIKKYKLAWYDCARKYVNNILMHAFIPENYSDSLFNYINRFYRIALNSTVPEDISDRMELFAKAINSDDFAEKFPDLKNMNLIVPSRQVLKNAEYFGPIVTKIIRRIANDYDSIDEVNLGVFEDSFRRWSSAERMDRRRKATLNESPYIQYNVNLLSKQMRIIIPPRVIFTDGHLMTIRDSNGVEVYSAKIYVDEQFDCSITREWEVIIDWDPLDPFTIDIDGNRIYNNANPGHIILNKHGRKRSRLSLGSNMLIVPPNKSINLMYNVIGSGDGYDVLSFIVNSGEVLEVDDYSYTIESEVSDSVRIISNYVNVTCNDQDGNKYLLFSKLPTISISADSSSRFTLLVSHGLNRFVIKGSELSRFENIGHDYIINLEDLLEPEDGIYKIRVNNRENYHFVVIKDFEYSFPESEYSETKTSFMDCTYIENPIQFNTAEGLVRIPDIFLDGRTIQISVQIPSRRYSFDKKNWRFFNEGELTPEDLQHEKIYIYCPTLVIPVIKADYEGSKPLNLDIEGMYQVAPIKSINMIGLMIDCAKIYKPTMHFKCGRFDLFTIRYTANYVLNGFTVSRSNAMKGTVAIAKLEDGAILGEFKNSFKLPTIYGGVIEIFEQTDDGFSQKERFAFSIDCNFHIIHGKCPII